tara:strand:- start:38886 stop:39578 length:693 start_codon:yes stop_codon:yes gene_type:complete
MNKLMKQKKLPLLALSVLLSACPSLYANTTLKGLNHLAKQGDAASQVALGVKYHRGEGVKKNDTKAFTLFQEAAQQEDLEGIIYLGKLCREGEGTEKNPERAAQLFKQAADLGDPIGQIYLGELLLKGEGVSKNERQALAHFLKSAKQGQPVAQNYVASLYGQNPETPQDRIEAYAWGIIAEAQGETDWKKPLLVSLMTEEEVEAAQKRAKALMRTIYEGETLETLSEKS